MKARLFGLWASLTLVFTLVIGSAPFTPVAYAAAPSAWAFPNNQRANLFSAGYGNVTTSSAATVMLVTSSSNIGSASTTCSGVTGELSTANGYTTGGVTATLTAGGSAPTATVTFSAPVTWTATGTLTFRYAVVCINSKVFAYDLLDSTPADVTVSSGSTFTLNNTTPVSTLS